MIEKVKRMLGLSKQTGNKLVINSERLERRVALLEDGRLEEYSIERESDRNIVNSIFKGRGKNIENCTSTNTRFLANRNSLLAIAKNSQHLLLLMLLPSAGIIVLEGLFVLLMTRNAAIAKRVSLDVFADCWRLRQHVFEKRKRIRSFRRRGDFWMLRFFRLGFGRSYEIKAILKRGFPKFNRP